MLNRTHLLVVQLNGFNVDRSRDLILYFLSHICLSPFGFFEILYCHRLYALIQPTLVMKFMTVKV